MNENVKVISIIGVGYLGKQIAEQTSLKPYKICLYDTNKEDLDKFARILKEKKKSPGEVTSYESIRTAVKDADLVMILTPDEFQSQLYKTDIEPNIKQGGTLAFAHGFSIHYNQVVPRADLDVIMIAPKAPGHTVRSEFVKGMVW